MEPSSRATLHMTFPLREPELLDIVRYSAFFHPSRFIRDGLQRRQHEPVT